MRIRNLIFVLSVIFVASVSSCSKEKAENKIVGTWKQISVGQIPEGTEYIWTFEEDNKLYISTYQNSTIAKVDTANWDVEMRFARKNYINVKNTDLNNNGKYMVIEADEFLKIQRTEFPNGESAAAYLWLEFERK